ncbi:hypothetical protein HCN51_16685 [Nonomuraea sp. FMUSA5-5]|uniref:DUF4232 domain-containing protein n=1 Tax=Nonomuraea composti TaxID=2720023 RepID=A0ABX1B3D6_9ACTN|nr:hypothetical protein [Nonomuraea sp. FMUSA5-5]NJP91070.1 hypothetical protein [Nonomuraea sp. FMUSA5-5]
MTRLFPRSTFLTTAALLGAVVVAALGAQTEQGRGLLVAAGLAGAYGGYTELAFTAPQALPDRVPATSYLAPPSFTVRNVTGRRHEYAWSIRLTESGRTRDVAGGRVTLAAGQPVTITPSTKALCEPGPVTVGVRLDSGEAISFRATCSANIDEG